MHTVSVGGVELEIGTLGQWVAATVTFLAVLVALFKDEVMRHFRKPELLISIVPRPPDCHETKLTWELKDGRSGEAPCYYFRLWIRNKGSVRAESVQVYAARLERQNIEGVFEEVKTFPPMNLRWSHGGSKGSEVYAAISPEMGRHCDLAHVVDPDKRSSVGETPPSNVKTVGTTMAFDLEMKPASRNHIVPAGKYRLALRIAAANCAPRSYALEIELTGKWYEDEDHMLADGIRIRLLN